MFLQAEDGVTLNTSPIPPIRAPSVGWCSEPARGAMGYISVMHSLLPSAAPNGKPTTPPATPGAEPWVAVSSVLFLALILQVGVLSVGNSGTRQPIGRNEEALAATPLLMASVRHFTDVPSGLLAGILIIAAVEQFTSANEHPHWLARFRRACQSSPGSDRLHLTIKGSKGT